MTGRTADVDDSASGPDVPVPDPPDPPDPGPEKSSTKPLAWTLWALSCLSVGVVGVVHVLMGATEADRANRAQIWSMLFTAVMLITVVPSPPAGVIGRLWLWGAGQVRRLVRGTSPLPPPDLSRRSVVILGAGLALDWWGWRQIIRVPLPPPPLRGAGWRSLFLTGSGTAQPWWQGVPLDGQNFEELSGMELLRESSDQLSRLDFITCPNDYVAQTLTQKINSVPGLAVRADRRICTESMVVLGQRPLLAPLVKAGIVVRTSSGLLRFDLARYTNRCTMTWNAVDSRLHSDDHITLFAADPLHASGGENFLLAIYSAWKNDPGGKTFPTAPSLWRSGGPLAREMPHHSTQLWENLQTGHMNLIYTYEHLALTTVAEHGSDYFMIRTLPEVRFNQHLLTLSPRGLALDALLADSAVVDEIARSLRIPSPPRTTAAETTAPQDLPDEVRRRLQAVTWDPRHVRAVESDIDEIYALYRQT